MRGAPQRHRDGERSGMCECMRARVRDDVIKVWVCGRFLSAFFVGAVCVPSFKARRSMQPLRNAPSAASRDVNGRLSRRTAANLGRACGCPSLASQTSQVVPGQPSFPRTRTHAQHAARPRMQARAGTQVRIHAPCKPMHTIACDARMRSMSEA
jgi:hypothetical protein